MELSEFVKGLTEGERLDIVADMEHYERTGWVGDCTLRDKTMELFRANEVKDYYYSVPLGMNSLTNAVYKYYAYKWLGGKMNTNKYKRIEDFADELSNWECRGLLDTIAEYNIDDDEMRHMVMAIRRKQHPILEQEAKE